MSKKLSRAQRKQTRQKTARNRPHPSSTPALATPPEGHAPAPAQSARHPATSPRTELGHASTRNRRQEKKSARRARETEAAAYEPPPEEKKPPLSRWAAWLSGGMFSNRRKRGEHALLVFLALVMLGAVIVFVAQRGRSGRAAPEPASTSTPAAEKPAAPVPDLAAPLPVPLPPQDDHSPPTIVTAPAKPPPAAAASGESLGATPPDSTAAKPAEALAKPAEAPAKPAEAPAKPAEAPAKPAEAPAKPAEAPAKPAAATPKPKKPPAPKPAEDDVY